jgi:outer membrane protein OmpA-like peptidoglycan-associated protein
MNQLKLIFSLLFVASTSLCAADTSATPPANPNPRAVIVPEAVKSDLVPADAPHAVEIQAALLIYPIEKLEQRLDAEALKVKFRESGLPDLLPEARYRIQEFTTMLKSDPKDEDLKGLFKSCSLLVEAAILQMNTQSNRIHLINLHEKRTRLLTELNNIHKEIIGVERGFSTGLQANLDDHKKKLAAEQAKLAEEQAKLAEARALAAQMQEDARNRLNSLQSELISVKKDARGIILSMSDILFAVNKADLSPDLKTSLAKIAGILTVYKQSSIIVEGHTDNTGSVDHNQKLSEQRAGNVLEFLVEQGLAKSRLKSVGFGMQKPVASNDTKEGRQKNRRVDLIIVDDTLK